MIGAFLFLVILLRISLQVVRMLLRLLEDKNGEVQNLAVKCLGPLVHKVKEPQVRHHFSPCSSLIFLKILCWP